MYLKSVEIRNIRSIKRFKVEFDADEYAGWHVLLGDNGSGKSTFVRSVALGLVGPSEAAALRQNWADWLRDEEVGKVKLLIAHDPKLDKGAGQGKTVKEPVEAGLRLQAAETVTGPPVALIPIQSTPDPYRYVWGGAAGWFSASYGPFRRFSGGDKAYEKLFYSNPRLAAHLTAFGEDVALTEAISWLQSLYVQDLEDQQQKKTDSSGQTLASLKRFLNEGNLLPHNTKLVEFNSGGAKFRDGTGATVFVDQLSDGYRSILSMTFELIRQMVRTYGHEDVFRRIREGIMEIDLPGVVLVDEIDAHLHPPWQRRIGKWFCKYFPKLQFIVTTHSPLVCQAAENGTIWRLPTPGSDAPSGRITGTELNRLIYGNVLEAYSTELFGKDVKRSDSAAEKMQRLAELNLQSLRRKLNRQEANELQSLRAALPAAANLVQGENGESE